MRVLRFVSGSVVGVVVVVACSAAPALAAAPETPVTVKATAVTGDSAVLHGELNPGKAGEAGEKYQFLYSVSPTECHVPEHTTHFPEPPAESLLAKEEAVSIEAAPLQPGTTYSFCVLAEQEGQEAQSPSLTFTTQPTSAPFVYPGTSTATEVTAFSATLNAAVNPELEKTEYSFEYATNKALTGAQTLAGSERLQATFGEQAVSARTGAALAPEATYYFRVLATNATGTTRGPVETFTTQKAAKPVVLSEGVSAVNTDEPLLEALIDPEYEETSYSFQYSTEESGGVLTGAIHTLAGAPPAPLLPAVFEEFGLHTSPVGMPGLQGGVVYYYRAVASDKTSEEEAHGPVYGPVQSFQADGAPPASTGAAGEVAPTTARVAGSIVPQGLQSTYHFAYIPLGAYDAALAGGASDPFAPGFGGRSTYETKLTEGEQVLTDHASHPVELRLEELAPSTTYVYALVASNELGTTVGTPETFTTAPAPPAPAGPVAVEPSSAPVLPAFAPVAVTPLLSYASIAQLDAQEAREAKRASAPKKKHPRKKPGKRRRAKSKRRRRA